MALEDTEPDTALIAALTMPPAGVRLAATALAADFTSDPAGVNAAAILIMRTVEATSAPAEATLDDTARAV